MGGWVNERRARKQEDWWLSRWMVQVNWESSYPPSTIPITDRPALSWKITAYIRLHSVFFFKLAECNALSDYFYLNDLPSSSHTCTHEAIHIHKPHNTHVREKHTPAQTNKQTQSYTLTCFSSTGGQLQQAPCQVNILKPCALTAEGKAQCWKHTPKYKK